MKTTFFLIILIIIICTVLFPQEQSILTVSTSPGGVLPLGSSTELFKFSGGLDVSASFFPAVFRGAVGFGVAAGALYLPLKSEDGVTAIRVSLEPILKVPFTERLSAQVYANIGYFYWLPVGWDEPADNGGFLKFGAGAEASFLLGEQFALGLNIGYDYYARLLNCIHAGLTFGWNIPIAAKERPERIKREKTPEIRPMTGKGRGIAVENIQLQPVFPVLYTFYSENPIGTAIIRNEDTEDAEEVTVTFFVERFMDNPMVCTENIFLDPGEERNIDIFAVFNEEILQITEGTKASAKITVSYTMDMEPLEVNFTSVCDFNNRNALVWDDDRKVSAFVTAKDPVVLNFSKSAVNWLKEKENIAVDENFQKGMMLFQALHEYGLRYEVDPSTPFTEFYKEKQAVDFLQFPRQTLQFSNGDCDDLSVAFNALMEAAGVGTAFITIPGHIYPAFALSQSPEEARKKFTRPDNFIITGNTVWLPIEITLVEKDFLEAWQAGAKEWRENSSRNQAEIILTRTAWETYPAAGFREGKTDISLPEKSIVQERFAEYMEKHIEKEMFSQVAVINARIQEQGRKNRYVNELAVLYARYGLFDKSAGLFKEILYQEEYTPALINLGNIAFLQKEYYKALDYYEKVLDKNSLSRHAILGASRIHHQLENYGMAARLYAQLRELDPDLALRFAYLDMRGEEAVRAADTSGLTASVIWEEE